jgi:hypothetical protein
MQHENTILSWVFIYVGCHMSLASHVTIEWMDVMFVWPVTCSQFIIPCCTSWVGITLLSEMSPVLLWAHPAGPLQDSAPVLLNGAEHGHVPSCRPSSSAVSSQFISVTYRLLSSITSTFSLSKFHLSNSYVLMSWFLQYQGRDKKLKLHVGEFGTQRAVICFQSHWT